MIFSFLMSLLASPAIAEDVPSHTVVIDLVDNADIAVIYQVENTSNVVFTDVVDVDHGIYRGHTEDPQYTLQILNSSSQVESAEPLMTFRVQGEQIEPQSPETCPSCPPRRLSTDPDHDKQWHLRKASSEYTWANTSSGKDVVVAVLDTGFTLTKDFNPTQVLPGKSFTGEPVTDAHGHGTHCASTIAQWTNNGFAAAGLAKNAIILPVKVLSDAGFGYNDWIASGIDWAADSGARVISMSLGGPSRSQVINRAIDRAIAKGVVVVAASGNDNGPVGWPAKHEPVIAVGSIGPDDLRAYYSNYGPALDISAPGGNKKLPGGGVFQWINFQGQESLQEWQGTSMATPHVAAAAAVLLGEGVKPERVEKLLKHTADAPPAGADPTQYGAGIMNLQAAVEKYRAADKHTGYDDQTTYEGMVDALPHPSPAGAMTFGISGLAVVILLLLNRLYKFSRGFMITALTVAAASSGALYALTYLPVHISALSILMVPWLEVPEYLVSRGITGCPVWMSFLPVLVPFLVLTPFPKFRPIAVGLLSSTLAYLLLDSAVHFNPVWWMTSFGSSCWLGFNALVTAGLLFISTEFHSAGSAS